MARAQGAAGPRAKTQAGVTKYVRYEVRGKASYGLLNGDIVEELRGSIFSGAQPTGSKHRLADVRMLVPCEPSKIVAAGLNYKSHLGKQEAPKKPEFFLKTVSSLLENNGKIVFPEDASNVHYEGEMVLVIGKRTKNVSAADVSSCVFGVTCGNDVSERNWQRSDLQWWRAKSSDTFGCVGPCIAVGLNYGDLLLQTRLNGEVKQSARTSDLLYNVPTMVSFISKVMTLLPGDLVYTGTPGQTSAMKSGDVIEVELEGVGVLRNTIA
jgi:2-keto-4-pentenoate hydratase/2-oxohepta-3-ene-1,7-dioic acid hydratase in catechol pathway